MEGGLVENFWFVHSFFIKFHLTESPSSKSSETKNYLGIMLRLAFRNCCHKRGFFAMCCEKGHAIENILSLSSRRLLFEFGS